MKEFFPQLRVPCKTHTGRLIAKITVLIALFLVLQTFIIPSGKYLSQFYAPKSTSIFERGSSVGSITSPESIRISKLSLLGNSENSSDASGIVEGAEKIEVSISQRESNADNITELMHEPDNELDDETDLDEDVDPDDEFTVDIGDGVGFRKANNSMDFRENAVGRSSEIGFFSDGVSKPSKGSKESIARKEAAGTILLVKKKNGNAVPPIYISEMNQILLRNQASYNSVRPRRYSQCDKELLAAKAKIENAHSAKDDGQLYAPAFRNIAMFKRSYELMEKTLKVYIYKEGEKPIFHEPLLKGIYASEGWFMKLMEANKQFVIKDPRKAHLFYMPFSSRLLQSALYVRNSHDRRNLEQYLMNYVQKIAAKYPFWNRTGGSDHFLVACHDWAPYETRNAMQHSIRALCVADLHGNFQLSKDVSLPQAYVHSVKNPLKNLGGAPPTNRSTLAFYSGSLHGPLRSVLLQHWENKDPDMKIYGPLPAGTARKISFVEHMKSSKYCICPKGYEVNSPRVVESIFYECVPVIISDNYVPPLFEVLNWEAFSVIIREDDVWRLKEILVSISEEKYFALQEGVRKVQQHFLWNKKPVKYDLFHMVLHSIWFNRVYSAR